MLLELALGLGGSSLFGYLLHAARRSARARARATDRAWRAAAAKLGDPSPAARAFLYRGRCGYRFHVAEHAGQKVPYLACDAIQLPSLAGVKLSASPGFGLFKLATGDATFDREWSVHSSPEFLGRAFFDAATRALLRDRYEVLEVHHGMFRTRTLGTEREEDLIDLATLAEGLAERWLALATAPLRLAETLGFEPTEQQLSLVAAATLARSFRHGLEWLLQLAPGEASCDLVLRAGDVELRFDWLTPHHEIGATFAAKQSELSANAAYR